MATPIYCTVCHDEVTLGGQLLPTGPTCADCAANAATEPEAPTHPNNPGSCTPRATEDGDETAAADVADRAASPDEALDVFGPLQFRPPKYAKQLSMSIEEWFFLGSRIVATPYELNLTGKFLASMYAEPDFDVRFVIVLSWVTVAEQGAPWRDIGPTLSIAEGFNGNRVAALQAATTEARTQAKRLKAVGPFGFIPARQIN